MKRNETNGMEWNIWFRLQETNSFSVWNIPKTFSSAFTCAQNCQLCQSYVRISNHMCVLVCVELCRAHRVRLGERMLAFQQKHIRGTFIISLFILLSTVGSCQWIYLNSIRIPFYGAIHKIYTNTFSHIIKHYIANIRLFYVICTYCTRHQSNQTSQQAGKQTLCI